MSYLVNRSFIYSCCEHGHEGIMLEQEKETSALKEKLAESDLKSVFKLVAFQFVCG